MKSRLPPPAPTVKCRQTHSILPSPFPIRTGLNLTYTLLQNSFTLISLKFCLQAFLLFNGPSRWTFGYLSLAVPLFFHMASFPGLVISDSLPLLKEGLAHSGGPSASTGGLSVGCGLTSAEETKLAGQDFSLQIVRARPGKSCLKPPGTLQAQNSPALFTRCFPLVIADCCQNEPRQRLQTARQLQL